MRSTARSAARLMARTTSGWRRHLTMYVVDDSAGRGYAYIREDGEIYCLAATDEDTATALLWRCFAHAVEIDKPVTVSAT